MPKPVKLVIVGAGGLGREILATVRACNQLRKQWDVLGFLDSNPDWEGREVSGVPVLGGDDWARRNRDNSLRYICAIGDPSLRVKIVENLSSMKCRFASVIHPSVQTPDSVEVGAGSAGLDALFGFFSGLRPPLAAGFGISGASSFGVAGAGGSGTAVLKDKVSMVIAGGGSTATGAVRTSGSGISGNTGGSGVWTVVSALGAITVVAECTGAGSGITGAVGSDA